MSLVTILDIISYFLKRIRVIFIEVVQKVIEIKSEKNLLITYTLFNPNNKLTSAN